MHRPLQQNNTMAMVAEHQMELSFPYWNAIPRRFKPDAHFFASGNVERELLAKQVTLDLTEDERYQIQNIEDAENWEVYCPISGCGALLNTLEDFEDHYHARHTASCSVCSRVYPTSRLLSIHVSEQHDSFFQAKVARGYPMYECLVESCGEKLKSYRSRQQHLVDKHKFPPSFDFYKKGHASKKQRQKNNHRKQVTLRKKEDTDMKVDQNKKENTDMEVDKAIDSLVSGVSRLTTSDLSPSSVSFGRRNRGLSFVPRAVEYGKKQNSSFEDKK